MRTKNRIQTAQSLIVGAIALFIVLTSSTIAWAREAVDADITSAINTEMWGDHAVLANDVDVTTKDGVVTLKGTVNNILAKDRAVALVEATVGVRAVVNMLDVQPVTPRDDKELAMAVEYAWLADPAADSYKLKAKADDGVVTISGTVQSYAEKKLSETVVKGVKGVKGIENEIKVEYKTKRTDLEIRNEVAGWLENDVRVDDCLIEVKVNKGDVTLSGTVGSLQEKIQAGRNAWVAGVKSVAIDGLEVKWWARDKMRRTNSFVLRTDEEIKRTIKDVFLNDPRVLSFNLTVAVTNGTVALSGIVDNLKAKRAAEQYARNTLGVWRVKNYLKVRSTIPTNEELEKQVATALLENPYVERYEVNIDANGGWVYFSGDVNTLFEKSEAERVTEGLKGVVGVVNHLNYYENQWDSKPDWEIREDVKEQLWWSPFVDENDINVSVDDGVVTLSGTVNSWSEYNDAEKNAFQGGAKNVSNKLIVNYRYYGPYGPGYYGAHYYHNPNYYEPYYELYQ